ncbi:TetR family transcriptional regulator [Ramlibacter albus]|uniref:TetR family transcriptional regulator n=1 Tax=Ramlibacter albus TaxID=2079448 RepID=A0A923S0V5_9BURK|nr:TetR family transcriptional regulator [Ramlibacter albus]MBC5762983.1 TetR family transcriptional regulator [Ramlibacter albus]
MPRRTKEEALATRNRLLDAAERQFLANGVAGTSLNDIAMAAGTTRGAIYWHFRDKADLFNAMMDRVTLPLQAAASRLVESSEDEDALPSLRSAIRAALSQTVRDPQTRRVFEIATHKVEYVDSLFAIRERHQGMRMEWVRGIRRALRVSAASRGLRLPMTAAAAAHGLQALVDGLIQNWLLDTSAFNLEVSGDKIVGCFLAGLGFD